MTTFGAASSKSSPALPSAALATPPLLEVRNVGKQFSGVEVLKGVSFAVRAGSVHALLGENGAGKSTLMKILIGWHPKDSGDILIRGEPTHFTDPKHALRAGVSIIQQELSPVRHMSVAENIFLGREPRRGPFVDYRRLHAQTRVVLEPLGLELRPDRALGSLSLAEIQLVEIAKALSHNADIVIMDEPTSALGEREVERLLAVVGRLKAQGKGVIYISHKLEEVFAVADDVTVLRDGALVRTSPAASVTRDELIRRMIGKEVETFARQGRPAGQPAGQPLLSVTDFSRAGEFEGVTLELHEGEILGVFGLMGAGKSELLAALFGVTRPERGELVVGGKTVRDPSPTAARAHGLAFVTEDRKKSGLMLAMSVRDNIGVASLSTHNTAGVVTERALRRRVDGFAKQLDVRAATLEQPVRYLSGGNQQKAILARWLMTEPRVLLLDEPTRGIDVGAKRDLYSFVSAFAAQNRGVIMASSELPEILGMSDRVAVLRRGRLAGILPRAALSKEALMDLAL